MVFWKDNAQKILKSKFHNFMFKPCIDMTSLNNNQLMHSQFNIY